MPQKGRNIIVVGTSAGGLAALSTLVGALPKDLPAAIFAVQHMAPEYTPVALLNELGRHRTFHCKLARDGERFKRGWLYVAPPDHHLLVKASMLLVTKGARENRYRPAIDPLFRSAAVSHGSHVIGVLLTGMLDDGTAGLTAIKRCGGVTIIQDPDDAAYPDMPKNALENGAVDHCIPLAGMGGLLERLCREAPGKTQPIPKDIRNEAEIAERVLSDVGQVDALGTQVPFNCPNCGGTLWKMKHVATRRYRCHTGHSFTAAALLAGQSEKIEESMWVSLRMLEERRNLLNRMAREEPRVARRRAYVERAKETAVHIERIRKVLVAPETR